MQIQRIRQQAAFALGFFDYIKEPLTCETAIRDLTKRIDEREVAFLNVTKKLIYDLPRSPYRKLLFWAGCEYADLASSVKTRGMESTLQSLRDAGVYLTMEEFKSRTPVSRTGLTMETSEGDFDNPYVMGRSIEGATSGSTSKSVRVLYDWNFFAEEAANEMLLHQVHGVSETPSAFWLPSLPSISGIHNLLVQLKFRKPPDKWFSHLEGNAQSKVAMEYLRWNCRFYGIRVPRPEFTTMTDGERVARWMHKTMQQDGCCVVKTFASSAVRIAQAAQEQGIHLNGCVVFTGGEPLTNRRHRYLQSAGIRAYPRYVATETGLIAAGCPNAESVDSMHLYTDRLALIQRERTVGPDTIPAFLFSTLSCNTGKVLLNTELGDFGNVENRTCDCLFGKTGMNVRISEVRNFDKVTGEGMTVLSSVLNEVIGEVVENAGGGPDDYQFWEKQDNSGIMRLTIAVSPAIPALDEGRFVQMILDTLKKKGPAAEIASQFWQQAGTLKVVRTHPEISKGFKLLPFVTKS